MDKYGILLKKFAGNTDLKALLLALRKEDLIFAEQFYLEYGKYPEKRNLIDKLEFDLEIGHEITKKIEEAK